MRDTINAMRNRTYWTRDRIMKLIIGVAISACLIMLINYLRNVLLPFAVACLISYLLNPLVELNRRWMHTKGRALAVIVTLLEVVAVIGGIIYAFLPSTISQINKMGLVLAHYADDASTLAMIPPEVHQFMHDNFDINSFSDLLKSVKLPALMEKGTSVVSATIDFLGHTLQWLLMFIYIIFILLDYEQISRGFKLIFPARHRDKALKVIDDMKTSMNHYFRGQGLVALGAMVLYCIGFSIVGIPLAIMLGLLVGILYMIPYFQYITIIPVAFVCFVYSLEGGGNFWVLAGYCGLVYVVSQSICDYILTPHIMGKELNMNPAIILLSLSVWGSLLGIIGMIIALPVSSLLMSYYQRYISNPTTITTSIHPT